MKRESKTRPCPGCKRRCRKSQFLTRGYVCRKCDLYFEAAAVVSKKPRAVKGIRIGDLVTLIHDGRIRRRVVGFYADRSGVVLDRAFRGYYTWPFIAVVVVPA